MKLSSPEELRRHFHIQHPLELPVLYVRGEPLLRESVIRRPIAASDVELVQCSRCEVQTDGGSWKHLSVGEFRKHFAYPTDATWNVRLFHDRSEDNAVTNEDYHVRFRVPGNADLDAVDQRFISTLVIEELHHSDLERFVSDLPPGIPVREYANALGNYTLGILIKERRSPLRAPVGFERFAELMKEALDVLRLFSRPVAVAVCASIRFMLNDFTDHRTTESAEIEIGLRLFRQFITGSTHTAKPHNTGERNAKLAICPVDAITHRLLSACKRLHGGGSLSLSELEALRQLTRAAVPISEQDLAKTHALCAEGYSRLGQTNEAISHLREIQYLRPLNQWVQQLLASLSPNGS